MAVFNNQLVVSSWGGVMFFDRETKTLLRTITTMNNLRGNNVLTLLNYGETELMMAVSGHGIERFVNNRFHVTLTEGLPSTLIYDIYANKNHIFIGSDRGLTYFVRDDNLPFPLFKETFSNSQPYHKPFTTVNSIISDESGYIYLGTNIGFSRVHLDSLYVSSAWRHETVGFRMVNINDVPTRVYHSVNSIELNKNIMAFATSQGLYFFDIDDIFNRPKWRGFHYVNDLLSFSDVKIIEQHGDLTVIGVIGSWNTTRNRYINTDRNHRSVMIIRNQLQPAYLTFGEKGHFGEPATSIFIDGNTVYATTWGYGIAFTNFETLTQDWFYVKPNTIHSNYISTIAVDNFGNMWFGDGIRASTPSDFSSMGVSTLNATTGIWSYYNRRNAGLLSDNIFTIDVASDNKVWLGSWWMNGIPSGIDVLNVSDPTNPISQHITSGLMWPTIADINRVNDQMWVTSYGGTDDSTRGGINIINNDLSISHQFRINNLKDQSFMNAYTIDDYIFVGFRSMGLRYRRGNTLPETGDSWITPPELHEGRTFQIASWQGNNAKQVWFAIDGVSSFNGIYYLDVRNNIERWFRISTSVRREEFVNGAWDRRFYFQGEERLFGGEPSIPTAILIDPFSRVWIGTARNGLAMYDIVRDRFYNFRRRNSDIPSDEILSLAYQPTSGKLYLGTTEGLVTLEIGRVYQTATELVNIHVFPNPFRPDVHGSVIIQNRGHDSSVLGNPIGENECRIFDISGQLITVLPESRFLEFEWDGTNTAGRKVSSGVYFYLIQTEAGDSARGKIVLIR